MSGQVQKSCWSVATWTVLALLGVLVLAYLLGGAAPAVTMAAG